MAGQQSSGSTPPSVEINISAPIRGIMSLKFIEEFSEYEIASMIQWQYRNDYIIKMVPEPIGMCIDPDQPSEAILGCMEWVYTICSS